MRSNSRNLSGFGGPAGSLALGRALFGLGHNGGTSGAGGVYKLSKD